MELRQWPPTSVELSQLYFCIMCVLSCRVSCRVVQGFYALCFQNGISSGSLKLTEVIKPSGAMMVFLL